MDSLNKSAASFLESMIICMLKLPIEERTLALPMRPNGAEIKVSIDMKHNNGCSIADTNEEINSISINQIDGSSSKIEIQKSSKQECINLDEDQNKLEEIERLKGYNYERKYVFNEITMRTNTILICKYEGCDKVCSKTWDLLDHMRKHTGEKPYKCMICMKTFSQRGNVIKHKKMHQKERQRLKAASYSRK